jgi:hypothetical protein
MKSVNELLELVTRQAALEKAMRQPGGARVIEERELLAVRRKLAAIPEAIGESTSAAPPRPDEKCPHPTPCGGVWDELVDTGDELVK